MFSKRSSLVLRVALLMFIVLGSVLNTSSVGGQMSQSRTTERISVSSHGDQGDAESGYWGIAISDDGHNIVFSSKASNLADKDINGVEDIFLHNVVTGKTSLISKSSDLFAANGESRFPSISSDGRYIAFVSSATNLVNGDTNSVEDVFLYDTQTDITELVSISSNEIQGNKSSFEPSMSADGRYVAFSSGATNLVNGDTNNHTDVFLRDRQSGTTQRISISSKGKPGDDDSNAPSISDDGRYIAFQTWASVFADRICCGYYPEIFLHDRQEKTTKRISISSTGAVGNYDSTAPSISGDGRYIAYASIASNLVNYDTNQCFDTVYGYHNCTDVFVYDRVTRVTERVSISSFGDQANEASGSPSISVDGRFISFLSNASNLVTNDTNGQSDVFLYDRQTYQTERVSISTDGEQANNISYHPYTSIDGRFIAFTSRASNLVTGDTNQVSDVFVHDRGGTTSGYSISGHIMDWDGKPIPNVQVMDEFENQTYTDLNGNYFLPNLEGNTHTIIPSMDGYTFSPRSRSVSIPPSRQNQNFVGKRIPIILIPGIMGSRLFSESEQIWPNLCRMLNPWGLSPLRLKHDGINAEDSEYNNIASKDGQAGIIDQYIAECGIKFMETHPYSHLIDHLAEKGYIAEKNLFFFPYDWRKDLRISAARLDSLVEQVKRKNGSKQVIILAHSMGGLVARQYIMTKSEKVYKLITLGTPYLGAPKAYAGLLGEGCTFSIGNVQIGDVIAEACIPSPYTIKTLVPNFAAFHQLMPSPAYFSENRGGFVATIKGQFTGNACTGESCLSYTETYTSPLVSNINYDLVIGSTKFHGDIDRLTNWNGVNVIIFAGKNQQTIFGFEPLIEFNWWKLHTATKPIPLVNMNGDGTVPTISSTLGSMCNYGSGLIGTASCKLLDREHGDIVNAYEEIDCALNLGDCETLTLGEMTTNDLNTGTSTLVQIIASSVKAIDVTDNLGNHTGAVPQVDSIEEAIPGSSYFDLEGNASVALLGGQNYTFVITPVGDEPVDITILRTDLDGSISRLIYTGLIVTEASRIRLVGDPYQMDTWYLDQDGSGSSLTPVIPNLSYDPGDVIDTTPPTTTITIEGELGDQGWYIGPVTVRINAADSGVGVDRIEYAFANERLPRLYSGPFIVNPDQYSKIIAVAFDRAGNVQTEEVTARIGPDRIFMPIVDTD